ncbi:right-handed parallel beta-helix repeat-containing protein [Boseongicola aestuarii]|uniref:Right handed beta helix domain-containing protein n=1 Tax=Boseongicola aestuarii TaxID=1470561 RepID=A0A238J0W8_9RHOB|nr:right-handed parallel beta-helix repeat-containing protein [Boseongicola aestuarii]SMX24257.1 hypothetical protein BOA8489_02380 [Boseongicola aestuarii]
MKLTPYKSDGTVSLFPFGLLLIWLVPFAPALAETRIDTKLEMTNRLGGETLYLAPGDYGSVTLEGFMFDEPITIVSESAGQATIESLTISGSTNLIFEGIHFESPSNGTSASSIVSIKDSDNIQINHSEINGPVDDVYDGHVGVRVTDSSNVKIEGNFIHDVKRAGIFENTDGLIVAENTADYLGDDNYKFIAVNDVLIENNIGARHVFPSEGAHLDFIQFQGRDSSDIVIRGNLLLPENKTNIQGIFLDDAHYTNVLIEQNIIVTGMIRGISLSSGTNVVARDNTVLDIDGAGSKATKVMVVGERYGNIQGSYLQDAGVGDNLTLQQADPSRALHYDDVFENATVGLGMDVLDLMPIPDSLAQKYGAYERLLELLGL